MRITLIKDGKVENIILAESVEFAEQLFPSYICKASQSEEIGDLYNDATQEFTKAPVVGKKVLTRYEFMAKFTTQELAAIYTRANTDSITMVFVKKLEVSGEVNLDNPDVVSGLAYLVANNVITQARKDAILA